MNKGTEMCNLKSYYSFIIFIKQTWCGFIPGCNTSQIVDLHLSEHQTSCLCLKIESHGKGVRADQRVCEEDSSVIIVFVGDLCRWPSN